MSNYRPTFNHVDNNRLTTGGKFYKKKINLQPML